MIQETYAEDFSCLLRLGGNAERREDNAESKNVGDKYVNFETDKLIGKNGKAVELIFRVSRLDKYVLALKITKFTQLR